MIELDLAVTGLALAAGLAFPNLGTRFFAPIERWLDSFAHHRPLGSCALVAVLALSLRIMLLPVMPVPEPVIHDEFSYLLAADTFAQGRLANPTHPMWEHFETFHVNHHPSYMSMYPPAPGLVLAAAQYLTGQPWWGIWLTAGLACGAVTWALQGWLPPGWALLGGLLFMVRVVLFSYWMNSYYPAALAALGAALVTGACGRLLGGHPSWPAGGALGLGAVILASTRPFEGFLLCAAVGALLSVHAWRTRSSRPVALRVALRPAAFLLVAGLAALAYYDWRVYGDPLSLPYTSNRATYAPSPVFLWQEPGPIPSYRHQVLYDFYVNYELANFKRLAVQHGFGANLILLAVRSFVFFLYPMLTVGWLIGLPWLISDREVRSAWVLMLVPTLGVACVAFFMSHYLAAGVTAFYVLLVQSLRLAARHLAPQRGSGRAIVRNLVLGAALVAVIAPAYVSSRFRFGANWHFVFSPIAGRRAVIQELENSPGNDLVIVKYSRSHDSFVEWVYNRADIDRSTIVWARDMGDEHNATLLRYFEGRKIWQLEADAQPPRLSPYQQPRHAVAPGN